MKKSTLLTVASVGAVALTSAMTFAAWDNLSDTTTSNEVTFKQINVTKEAEITLSEPVASDLSSTYVPSTTGEVTFNVEGIDASDLTGKQLELVPVVKADGTEINSGYSLEIYDGVTEGAEKVDATNIDKSVTATNAYKVVVKATNDQAGTEALANKKVTVELTATLQNTTN